MSRLRISGRGIAYGVSGLIHAGVIVALIPSLVGVAAAPASTDTPMAVDMPVFSDATLNSPDSVPIESAETSPPAEEVQAQPVDPAVTPMIEPPPDEAPVASALDAVTTTAQTDAVVPAVPDAVTAEEPKLVQPPPKRRPDPPRRTERQPPRIQPQRTVQTTETQTAALSQAQPAAPPPAAAASAAAGQKRADYTAQLQGYLGRRVISLRSMIRKQMVVAATVTIESDGTLSTVELTQSSGSSTVDAEILRKLRGASPVPAPPSRMANFIIPFRIDPR